MRRQVDGWLSLWGRLPQCPDRYKYCTFIAYLGRYLPTHLPTYPTSTALGHWHPFMPPRWSYVTRGRRDGPTSDE